MSSIGNEAGFDDCARQAREWLETHKPEEIIAEMRQHREERTRLRLGTPNCLILLEHLDRLDTALAKARIVVERYGAHYVRDEAWYEAAESLGMDTSDV